VVPEFGATVPAPLALVSGWNTPLLQAFNATLSTSGFTSQMGDELKASVPFMLPDYYSLLERDLMGGAPVPAAYQGMDPAAMRARLARESVIMLRNHHQIIPIHKKFKQTIAVMGPMANRSLPGWSGAAGPTLLELIRAQVEQGVEVRHFEGCDPVEDSRSSNALISAAVPASRQVDLTVLCLGTDDLALIPASGGKLPVPQEKLLRALYQATPNIILIVVAPRPVSLDYASTRIPGILVAWSPGADGAAALTEALFGAYNPGGRLPCDIPRTPDTAPSVHNPDPVFQVYTTPGPLYPAGFGLSLTRFGYSALKFTKASNAGELSVTITNEGDLAGEEVVQLYREDEGKPRLVAFERIRLEPGASRVVVFETAVPSKSRLFVGGSSQDARLSLITP
jgi:beta-glucosidase